MNIKTIKKGLHSLISPFQYLLSNTNNTSNLARNPISIGEFKVLFDRELSNYFEIKRIELQGLVGGSDTHMILELYDQAVRITLSGGKRIRPYMAYLSCMCGEQQRLKQDEIIRSTMCFELFHIFALIHDDIIDTATLRHGQKTVQNFFTQFSFETFTKNTDNSEHVRMGASIPHIGRSHAIMIGDLFFSMAHEAISKYVPVEYQGTVRNHFNLMASEVVVGEMLDVHQTMFDDVEDIEILLKTELKTAHYTFVNPMKIGFDLCGIIEGDISHADSNEYFSFATKFGYELGIGFQIQDDLLDITGSHDQTGKPAMNDISEGQHTVFTQFILKNKSGNINEADISKFKSLLSKRERQGTDLTEDERCFVRGLMKDSGAIHFGATEIKLRINRAKEYLAHSRITHKEYWSSIISLLENRSH